VTSKSDAKDRIVTVTDRDFRDALGRFASGVTVVTGVRPDGTLAGVTASAFTSVSLRPPLVAVCLDKAMTCIEAFSRGSHFAIHILGDKQKALSEHFGRRSLDKFRRVEYRLSRRGCPLLADSLAVIECARAAVHDAGDHFLILGRVEGLTAAANGMPLLHFRGGYHGLAERL